MATYPWATEADAPVFATDARALASQFNELVQAILATKEQADRTADAGTLVATPASPLKIEMSSGVIWSLAGKTTGPPGFYIKAGNVSSINPNDPASYDGFLLFTAKGDVDL